MTSSTWHARFTGLLVLLLFIANVWFFLSREWESSYFPSNYATLYYPLDVPTIRSWTIVDREQIQLHLACTEDVAEWRVLTEGGNAQTAAGMSPAFHIDTAHAQTRTYRLIPVPEGACSPIDISIRFFSREFYGSLGMEHDDVYIVRSSVPCGEFDQFSLSDWVDDYSYVGEEDLAAVDRILMQDVGIAPGDPTFAKMEKLAPFLRKKLQGSGGVPKDEERWMNPFQLYKEMAAGTGKGWCTQNAQIWTFWANRAGIPTRFVFNARTQDNTIVYTGHAFAESYIREQNRWAYVDLSQGQIYVTNKEGGVLNTAELLQLNLQNAFDSTFARLSADWQWKGLPGVPAADTVMTVPFALCNAALRTEFTPHSILKYRRPPNVEDVREIYTGFLEDRTFLLGNLERYLFKPQLAYSLYPTEGAKTYTLRRILFVAFVASFLYWIGALMFGRRRGAVPATAALLFLLLFPGCGTSKEWTVVPGQHPQAFSREITTTASANFLLYLPKDFSVKEGKKWPLLIFLHGAGERGSDLERVKAHGPPKLAEKDGFPFIVISPQVGSEFGWWSTPVLNALLDEAIDRLPVDEDRVYLTGLSMGGFGTWGWASTHPGRFAAIAPICGGGDTTAVCQLRNVPVWAFHGAKDVVVPLKSGESMVRALKRCGGDVTFTVYPDATHDSWTETYANPDLYAWFLRHRRRN